MESRLETFTADEASCCSDCRQLGTDFSDISSELYPSDKLFVLAVGGGDRRGIIRIDVPSHASFCSRRAKSSGPLSFTDVSPI